MAPRVGSSLHVERLDRFLGPLLGREARPLEMAALQRRVGTRQISFCLPQPIKVPIAHDSILDRDGGPVKGAPFALDRNSGGLKVLILGIKKPGNDLLSHRQAAVPSARQGLTSVFGMGTGGSPAP